MILHRLILLLLVASASALIPRETILSDSVKDASLSPDGKVVGIIAPDENKVRNVFVWTISERQKRQVTFEESNVNEFVWTGVQDVIIFTRDNNGDENYMMFARNTSEGATPGVTEIANRDRVQAKIVANNKKDEFILVGLNDEDPSYHNVYKYDIHANKLSLVLRNRRFGVIYADNSMQIRFAGESQDDGSVVYFRPSPEIVAETMSSNSDQWIETFRVSSENARFTKFLGFDETNENVYWMWGEGTDLGSVIIASADDISKRQVLYTAVKSEISEVRFHPEDQSLLFISEYYHTRQRVFVDKSINEDISYIDQSLSHILPLYTGFLAILDWSHDFRTWLFSYSSPEGSKLVFVYNRTVKSIETLFDTAPDLKGYDFGKQIGFEFTASDGLTIQAYISLPPNVPLMRSTDVPEEHKEFADRGMIPKYPQKMVLLVHGGPNRRDQYGFYESRALLTNRGYSVLQVNFRGSTGFGKHFYGAGNGEWSRKMHTDLTEAVEFAISKGIANKSAVAIMGGSYGGYAALVGLTFTPDTFACGIDIVGPSNLITLMNSLPPYWKSDRAQFIKWMGGDPESEDGRSELAARSPLFIADRVKKPLLIMQGANDPRVKQAESEQFVAALSNRSIPFTYVLYLDEGHSFKRSPNVLAKFGHVEKFLHKCLGGEYQSFDVGQYGENAVVRSESSPRVTFENSTSRNAFTLVVILLIIHIHSYYPL